MNSGDRFSKAIAYNLTLALMVVAAIVGADGETDGVVAGLPWHYEAQRVLERADNISVTMMRPGSATDGSDPAEAGFEIQYHLAAYGKGEDVVRDFDRILPKAFESNTSWQVALQTRNEIHWLRGQCLITKNEFRSIYAGVLSQVENKDGKVVSAILCRCGTPCERVMVDR